MEKLKTGRKTKARRRLAATAALAGLILAAEHSLSSVALPNSFGKQPMVPSSPSALVDTSSETLVKKVVKEVIPHPHVSEITSWDSYSFMLGSNQKSTITRNVFIKILQENGSPAESDGRHEGGAMFDAFLAEGVDPNIGLQIYFEESRLGTDGNPTWNICNMKNVAGVPHTYRSRISADFRAKYGDGAFKESASACASMIKDHYDEGYNTLQKLIYYLTPPIDPDLNVNNHTDMYFSSLQERMLEINRRSIQDDPPLVIIHRYVDFQPKNDQSGQTETRRR